MKVDGVDGRDHFPVGLQIVGRGRSAKKAQRLFLPSTQRIGSQVGTKAAAYYRKQLPTLAARLKDCSSETALHELYRELQGVIEKPFMANYTPRPARFTLFWTAEMDKAAKARSEAKERAAKVGDQKEAQDELRKSHRLHRMLQRMVKLRKHLMRQVEIERLRDEAEQMSPKDTSARLKSFPRRSAEADKSGEEVSPRAFTEFFAKKPRPKKGVPLRPFALHQSFELRILEAIKKADPERPPGQIVFQLSYTRSAQKSLQKSSLAYSELRLRVLACYRGGMIQSLSRYTRRETLGRQRITDPYA